MAELSEINESIGEPHQSFAEAGVVVSAVVEDVQANSVEDGRCSLLATTTATAATAATATAATATAATAAAASTATVATTGTAVNVTIIISAEIYVIGFAASLSLASHHSTLPSSSW